MKATLVLNDKCVSWYEGGEIKHLSPGFIYVENKQLIFGEAAEQQSRSHPLNTHHGFWHRLSQDSFARPVVNCRHTADLVFVHLNHMFDSVDQQAGSEPSTLLLTPASYNESQLALLSGVARHSPFKPSWMMPIPLAVAGSQLPLNDVCLVVEQYQHCLSLSLVRQSTETLTCDNAQLLPDLGYFSVANKLLQAASDAFVSQTRYNPQQNAAWEQSLYGDLPRWLQLLNQRETVIPCHLQTDSKEITATLQALECLEELAPSLEKLKQQWLGVQQQFQDVPVLLAGNSQLIPGLKDIFSSQQVRVVEDQEIVSFASHYVSRLTEGAGAEDEQSVSLVRDIRLNLLPDVSGMVGGDLSHSPAQTSGGTFAGSPYWLSQGVARAISPAEGCRLGLADNTICDLSSSAATDQAHVQISATAQVEHVKGLTVQLNGKDVVPGVQLAPGDVLSLGEQQVTFIAVVHDVAVEHGSQA